MEMGEGPRDQEPEFRTEDSTANPIFGPPSTELYPNGGYADHPWQLKPGRDETGHQMRQNLLAEN